MDNQRMRMLAAPRSAPPMVRARKKPTASRLSISLPASLYDELDAMVAARGFASRSDAISKMISEQLVQYAQQLGRQIMAGTITLIYDHAKPGLQSRLMKIQHKYLREIISSQHVHLEQHHSLEVLLVQGPGFRLKRIADELITCKGVKHGYLNVTSTVLPPIY
jgi:CopG family transcriptional regulator, nickel-responsive regulator